MAVYYTPPLDATQNDTYRRFPIDDYAKLRESYFKYTADVAKVDGDQVELFDFPPGRVRLLLSLCRLSFTAFGAARTLDIGHRAYNALSTPSSSAAVAENLVGFVAARDVSAALLNQAGVDAAFGTKLDLYSRGGIRVVATLHGIMPQAAVIEGYYVYAVE